VAWHEPQSPESRRLPLQHGSGVSVCHWQGQRLHPRPFQVPCAKKAGPQTQQQRRAANAAAPFWEPLALYVLPA
jgi:hypothetical protein